MFLPVEVVEECEEVEGELDPSFSLTLVECIHVHDRGWVVESRPTHHRTVHVPEHSKHCRGV